MRPPCPPLLRVELKWTERQNVHRICSSLSPAPCPSFVKIRFEMKFYTVIHERTDSGYLYLRSKPMMMMMMMLNADRQSRRRQTLRSRRTLSGRSSSSPSIETIPSAPSSAATSSDKNATVVLIIIVVVFVVCAIPEFIHRLVSETPDAHLIY